MYVDQAVLPVRVVLRLQWRLMLEGRTRTLRGPSPDPALTMALHLLGGAVAGNPCRVPRRQQGYGVRGATRPILPRSGAEPRHIARRATRQQNRVTPPLKIFSSAKPCRWKRRCPGSAIPWPGRPSSAPSQASADRPRTFRSAGAISIHISSSSSYQSSGKPRSQDALVSSAADWSSALRISVPARREPASESQ